MPSQTTGLKRRLPRAIALALLALASSGVLMPAAPVVAAEDDPIEEQQPARPATLPSVVLIVVDDLGWGELGCYGNRFNETPHIDRLAREGARFTQAYAASPISSPSRAALMTGQSPSRLGVTDNLPPTTDWRIPSEVQTLAELFRSRGYRTGLTGQWRLSGYERGRVLSGPSQHGFDHVAVSEQVAIGGGSYFHPYTRVDPKIAPRLPGESEYLIDRLNLEAVDFIKQAPPQPFFLLKSHFAVHGQLVGKPALVKRFRAKENAGRSQNSRTNNPHLAAQLKVIDDGVGQILAALKSSGRDDETIIIFTSDNGGDGRYTKNGLLRGAKTQLYEGGIRTPLLIRWPGQVPAETVATTPVIAQDLFATALDLLGSPPPPQTLDGVSLAPLVGDGELEPRPLAWHYPRQKPHFLGGRSCDAIRNGPWKLIEFFDDGHRELYNLADDPGEQNDLSAVKPDTVERLAEELAQWREQTTGSPTGDR